MPPIVGGKLVHCVGKWIVIRHEGTIFDDPYGVGQGAVTLFIKLDFTSGSHGF